MTQRRFLLNALVVLCVLIVLTWDSGVHTNDTVDSITVHQPLDVNSLHHKECINVDRHTDHCAFVKKSCKGPSGLYLKFYYCSNLWKPFSMVILVSSLLLLFGAISVVASDFFSVNLKTIASKLQLSESMAGVTILAFGNGSPDLFSTFSAMNSGSGSLAIGELIGAAFFIVSIVSGSMGVIQPFRSERITFLRDATFLTGAILLITWIVYHQRINWYHSLALILFYIIYVLAVVLGAQCDQPSQVESPLLAKPAHRTTDDPVTETTPLLDEDEHINQSHPTSPFSENISQRLDTTGHGIHPGTPMRLKSSSSSINSMSSLLHMVAAHIPHTTRASNPPSSIGHPFALSPHIGYRTSLFSAIEFKEQLSLIRRRGHSFHAVDHHNPVTAHDESRPFYASAPSSPSARYTRHRPSYTFGNHHSLLHFIQSSAVDDGSGIAIVNNDDPGDPCHVNINDTIPEIRLDPAIPDQPLIRVLTPETLEDYPSSKPYVDDVTLLKDIQYTLFPTLQDWSQKTTTYKLSSLLAMPLVFIFTLTVPVVETNTPVDIKNNNDDQEIISAVGFRGSASSDYLTVPFERDDARESTLDNDETLTPVQPWSRWLLAAQAIVGCTFITIIMTYNRVITPIWIIAGSAVGTLCAMIIYQQTTSSNAPSWFWMTSFAGFVVALHWVYLLVNEMIGLLQALGTIFNISDAIMGLTVFALGNSMGDLVANTAIAKAGYPTMAISACYAGPLLNMVLGVGISSSYQFYKTRQPFELEITPPILISCAGLTTVLLITLVVVNLNGYMITKELGWWMIAIYTCCSLINVFMEFNQLI